MSTMDPLVRWRRRARWHQALLLVALGMPVVAALVVLLLRIGGVMTAGLIGVVLSEAVILLWSGVRRIDWRWLARRLDASDRSMEDSAALLFKATKLLSPLQQMQQERLQQRLPTLKPVLTPQWQSRRLFFAASISVALSVSLLVLASGAAPLDSNSLIASVKTTVASTDPLRVVEQTLRITPPAYTGIAPSVESSLDATVPEGSQLEWNIQLDPQPPALSLTFLGQAAEPMTRDGAFWHSQRTIEESGLYRMQTLSGTKLADDSLHRLDVLLDQPPRVDVSQPQTNLTLVTPGQQVWDLEAQISDDYGITSIQLELELAQGSGESISVAQQQLQLGDTPPSGNADDDDSRRRHIVHQIDLDQLQMGPGDDLIIRLVATDNRQPEAQTTRGASFILRWPAEAAGEVTGLDGVVQRTLPAYFRSQRQLIIDSEALLAERDTISADTFASRSDAIGVDQRILRLRYGQFMGEESEDGADHASGADRGDSDHDDGSTDAHDDHDDAPPMSDATATTFGDGSEIVKEFGHLHDIKEAATLLDPEARDILRAALGEMWQAELHLRMADPAQALPYEYRALDLIKRVQQSTRIYLARVGLELPVPDESRRLTGELDDVSNRPAPALPPAEAADPLQTLWRELAMPPSSDRRVVIDGPELDAALNADTAMMKLDEGERLSLLAALDRVRRDPDCAPCREALRAALWHILPVPASAPAPRRTPSDSGRRYLQALSAEPETSP